MNFRARKYAGYGIDEVVYHNYFGDKWKGYFIECGAGTGDSCIFWDEQFHWRGLYIEASPTMYAGIEEMTNSYNIGLGRSRGIEIFTDVTSGPGGGNDSGSFRHTPELMEILKGHRCEFKKVPVQVITYKELIEYFQIRRVNLFVLDVEGYELDVMEGMRKSILSDVLVVEYPVVGFQNVVDAAKILGYRYDFVSGNNVYFSINFPKKEWYGETDRVKDL